MFEAPYPCPARNREARAMGSASVDKPSRVAIRRLRARGAYLPWVGDTGDRDFVEGTQSAVQVVRHPRQRSLEVVHEDAWGV